MTKKTFFLTILPLKSQKMYTFAAKWALHEEKQRP